MDSGENTDEDEHLVGMDENGQKNCPLSATESKKATRMQNLCKTLEMNPFVLGMKKAERVNPIQSEDIQRQFDDFRTEIDILLNDKKVQDAKLTSSLRSIKTFWSPELKKERSLRKEEAARCLQTREELNGVLKEFEAKADEMEILKHELMNLKNSQDHKHHKIVIEQEDELQKCKERIRLMEDVNCTQAEDIGHLQTALQELSGRLNETIESQHQIILVKDEAIESCTVQVEQLQKLADQQSDEIFVLQKRLEGLQASADGDVKKILSKEEEVKHAEKELHAVQIENRKLADKIVRFEQQLTEQEGGKSERLLQLEGDVERKTTELQSAESDGEEREKRIALLEDALRESVCIAAEREELLSQHIDMSDEASIKLQEHESMVDQFTMERHITNIKNAFLILSLSEKDVTIKALRENMELTTEKFFNFRQTALLSSISEKDSCIALFEMQSPSEAQRQEIRSLVQEKDSLLRQLKELAQEQMQMPLECNNSFADVIQRELKEAPSQTIFSTTRILIDGYERLEYYVEQLVKFFKVKEVEVFEDMPGVPQRNALIVRKPEFASREELLDDLIDVSCDTKTLRQYVDSLLSKLEED